MREQEDDRERGGEGGAVTERHVAEMCARTSRLLKTRLACVTARLFVCSRATGLILITDI